MGEKTEWTNVNIDDMDSNQLRGVWNRGRYTIRWQNIIENPKLIWIEVVVGKDQNNLISRIVIMRKCVWWKFALFSSIFWSNEWWSVVKEYRLFRVIWLVSIQSMTKQTSVDQSIILHILFKRNSHISYWYKWICLSRKYVRSKRGRHLFFVPHLKPTIPTSLTWLRIFFSLLNNLIFTLHWRSVVIFHFHRATSQFFFRSMAIVVMDKQFVNIILLGAAFMVLFTAFQATGMISVEIIWLTEKSGISFLFS